MKEFTNVRQIPGESKRRWFSSKEFDLIVWFSTDGALLGFELCYDKQGKERSLRWSNSAGFQHMAVDDGEQIFGKYKETPVLVADGLFDAKLVHSNFSEVSHFLPDEIADFVLTAIKQYPNGFAELPGAANKCAGTFPALVQEGENKERFEAKAKTIMALGGLGVIGVVALSYLLVESFRVTPPPSTHHVASERFTSYVNDWDKQVQAKLGKSCFKFVETGNQSTGVILSTSIMKDGTVEEVLVTKSSGIMELDEAAVHGVLGAAPFALFPPEIKRDTDILTITRTFQSAPCPSQ